jgi:protein gp37
MGAQSAIEWTDASWTPIRGVKGKWSCIKVSPGCTYCYAERLNQRFGGPAYTVGADDLRLDEKVLTEPLRWKRPRRVFVCSMTDLFEERVSDLWIGRIFGTMAEAWWHEFQVLTKRAERLYEWSKAVMHYPKGDRSQKPVCGWPPNVVVMVSAEDQQRADERIPWLLKTPAQVRGVSLEPLLGPINLERYLWASGDEGEPAPRNDPHTPSLHWTIVGGESGGPPERALVEQCCECGDYQSQHRDGARMGTGSCRVCEHGEPPDGCKRFRFASWELKAEALAWVRSIRDQCVSAGVPFFFKQLGGPTPKSGGRMLDGREWSEYPQ